MRKKCISANPQVTNRFSHTAIACYYRFDRNFTAEDQSNHTNASAYFTAPETTGDLEWYTDSGATNHITNNLNNLSLKDDYLGCDKLTVRNGDNMPITHIDKSIISTFVPNRKLLLNKMLHVPKITKKPS